MKSLIAALITLTAIACTPPSGSRPTRSDSELSDSIVMERTPCFGVCPVYRISLSARGRVVFSDQDTIVTDKISQASYEHLHAKLMRIPLYMLPESFNDNREYCDLYRTDAPTVITSVFMRTGVKTVKDYLGCSARSDSSRRLLRNLRLFENSVDSVTRAERWKKPYRWR